MRVVSVPATQAPLHSWPQRLIVIGIIVATLAGCWALWHCPVPRVDDVLTWEQLAPPPTIAMHPWRWILIHHSASRTGNSQSFDDIHVHEHGWDGIGYHFVIGNGRPMPLGRIDATFRWQNQTHGAHAGVTTYNQDGIGICLVGDYEHENPDAFQEHRLVELCAYLIGHIPTLSLSRLIGHRDVPGKATACPGQHLDLEHVRFQVREMMEKRGLTVR